MRIGWLAVLAAALAAPACPKEESSGPRKTNERQGERAGATSEPDEKGTESARDGGRAKGSAGAESADDPDEDAMTTEASEMTTTWEDAEAVLREAYEGNPDTLERHPRIEFLFEKPGTTYLIHRGKVQSGGGLEALAAYLRDVRFYERKHLEAGDMTFLVRRFRAEPSRDDEPRGRFIWGGEHGAEGLTPSLAWEGDATTYTLHDLHKSGGPGGGARPNPNEVDVTSWMLSLSAEDQPAWRSVRRQMDKKTGEVSWEAGE